jgi:hypothetical protein
MFLPERNRKSTIFFEWSSKGRVYSMCGAPVKLLRKFAKTLDHRLSACELRTSGIPGAGYGVFLKQCARKGQIMLDYGGELISFKAAGLLKAKVPQISKLSVVFYPQFPFCRA